MEFCGCAPSQPIEFCELAPSQPIEFCELAPSQPIEFCELAPSQSVEYCELAPSHQIVGEGQMSAGYSQFVQFHVASASIQIISASHHGDNVLWPVACL